jgi:WD40 repeat protein
MTPEEMKFRNISYILKGHTQRVNAVTVVKADVVLIPDPNFRVVSGSQDKTIRIWDGISGECTSVLTGHTASVTTLSCLDSARFVSGSKDRTLRIWDIRSEKCLKILKGHTSSIHTISTTDDYIFSGSADKTIRCWSARTGECLSVLHGHTDPIKSIAVIDHRRIVSGSYDGSLRLWDVATGTCLGLIENSGGLIANKSKGEIVSIRSGDVFNIIDVDSGDIIHTLKNNLSPDVRDIVRFGNTVLICHYDGTIGFLSKDGESYRKSVSFTKGLLSMSMQELGWFGAYGDVFGNVIVFEYLRNERVTRAWPIDTFEILDS